MSIDPTGSSHVPFMNNYLDNSQQTILMRDIATDLEIMGEHVLLLGNQGVGKNKIVVSFFFSLLSITGFLADPFRVR